MIENDHFGLVFAKTASINSGTGLFSAQKSSSIFCSLLNPGSLKCTNSLIDSITYIYLQLFPGAATVMMGSSFTAPATRSLILISVHISLYVLYYIIYNTSNSQTTGRHLLQCRYLLVHCRNRY
jgi:hypothetical protein